MKLNNEWIKRRLEISEEKISKRKIGPKKLSRMFWSRHIEIMKEINKISRENGKIQHTLIRIPEGNNSVNEEGAIFEELIMGNFPERHQLKPKKFKNKSTPRPILMEL